jgi:eukaryotic-like serine/threonine-protein kinase
VASVIPTDQRLDTRESCSLGRDSLEGVVVSLVTPSGALPVRLERVIGEGGIGVVYVGAAPGLRGPLAVKVLHARHAGDAGIVRRFEREAEHAQRLRHPNVILAQGHGTLADGRPVFAMELLEGATLGALVRDRGPLPIAEGLRLADQILAGLEALHDAGLVHRDLSPDNVFVTTAAPASPGRDDGPPGAALPLAFVRPHAAGRAVILDLGFAQEPGVDAGDGITPDSPGSLVGTLTFMAPEQATRGRAITARSDLFAAAVLLYYAFSGKLPFRGHDDLDVLVSVVRAAPVPLRRERRDAPAALEEALARALAKHPDARFASACEMRAALARILPPPLTAPKPRTGPRRAPAARRTPGSVVTSRLSA